MIRIMSLSVLRVVVVLLDGATGGDVLTTLEASSNVGFGEERGSSSGSSASCSGPRSSTCCSSSS